MKDVNSLDMTNKITLRLDNARSVTILLFSLSNQYGIHASYWGA